MLQKIMVWFSIGRAPPWANNINLPIVKEDSWLVLAVYYSIGSLERIVNDNEVECLWQFSLMSQVLCAGSRPCIRGSCQCVPVGSLPVPIKVIFWPSGLGKKQNAKGDTGLHQTRPIFPFHFVAMIWMGYGHCSLYLSTEKGLANCSIVCGRVVIHFITKELV